MALSYIRRGEDRYKVFKIEQKLKERVGKEKEEKRKKIYGKIEKFTGRIIEGKQSYKSGNPLKKLLKSSNKAIVKVGR